MTLLRQDVPIGNLYLAASLTTAQAFMKLDRTKQDCAHRRVEAVRKAERPAGIESGNGRPRFPQSRREHEEILEGYDLPSLIMAYKIALRLPLDSDIGSLPARAMIDAILDAECGADGEFVRRPRPGP